MNAIDSARPATHVLDAMLEAPDHPAVLLENGRVRVLDTRVESGQRPRCMRTSGRPRCTC